MKKSILGALIVIASIPSFGQMDFFLPEFPLHGNEASLKYLDQNLFEKLFAPPPATSDFPAWIETRNYYYGDVTLYDEILYKFISFVGEIHEQPDKSSAWTTHTVPIVIENATFIEWLEGAPIYPELGKRFKFDNDSDKRIRITRPVEFINCKFNNGFQLANFNFEGGVTFRGCSLFNFQFHNCRIETLTLNGTAIWGFYIQDSMIGDINCSTLSAANANQGCKLVIDHSEVRTFQILEPADELQIIVTNSKVPGKHKRSFAIYQPNEISEKKYSIRLRKSEFGLPGDSTLASIGGNIRDLSIDSCTINSDISFHTAVILNNFHITNSTFNAQVALNDASFPSSMKLRWDHLRGGKLSKFNKVENGVSLSIDSNEGEMISNADPKILEVDHYEDIMQTYQLLTTHYKSVADLESANACYIEMKDLQTRRLRYLHEKEGSFKSLFRLKLAQLLRVYTEYGTDPAGALVVSVWVVLFFGFVFFFFPSDWDPNSKATLIQNFKNFIQKNEKGYIKPFFVLLLGFLISLINAFTLSLNSFTTLGFGNIPTHGLGRYFCVLEGFIGWFLLSIFTVALINQVLS